MPIYEYACTHCGESVEKLQRMSDEPLTTCPACGESTLRRKVSAARFRLSGNGWYETDFKSDGQRNLSGDSNKTKQADGSNGKSADKETKKATGGDNKTTSDGNKKKQSGSSPGKAATGSAG